MRITHVHGASSSAATVAPFAFASLPAVSHAEISAANRMRIATEHLVRLDKITDAIGEIAGAAATPGESAISISIALRRTRFMDASHISSDSIGVAFAPSDAPTMANAVLVDAEMALVSALVTRALRQRAPKITSPASTPTPEIAGAFGALVHAVLRRAHSDEFSLRVIAAGPAQSLARDLGSRGGNGGSIVTAWLTVFVGEDAFDARVSVPVDRLPRTHAFEFSHEHLLAFDEAPIAIPIVLATCLTTRMELASLRPGDAFIFPPESHQLTPVSAGDSSFLKGTVTLIAASSERGLSAQLAEDGHLVVRTDGVVTHSWETKRVMTAAERDAQTNTATLEVLEDASIVVRVELGAVEMKAREWAALSNGDVVTLGRRLGDPATLRVGGVDVAYGELVQVDGEYGVRILGRPTPRERETRR